MPFFSVLAAATQAGRRIYPTHLHPDKITYAKRRRRRNVESAIGIQICWIVPIELDPLLISNKHGNLRAVPARIEDLLCLVGVGVKTNLCLTKHSALSF